MIKLKSCTNVCVCVCVPQVVVNKFEVANELIGLDCLSMQQNHLQLTPERAARRRRKGRQRVGRGDRRVEEGRQAGTCLH